MRPDTLPMNAQHDTVELDACILAGIKNMACAVGYKLPSQVWYTYFDMGSPQ